MSIRLGLTPNNMECPHLDSSLQVITIECAKSVTEWCCSVCKSDKSPWICLNCGVVHCGRYVNGHAKSHFETEKEHAVCMDCITHSVFCYLCDDFVINDSSSKHLEQVRSKFVNLSKNETTAKSNSENASSDNRLRKRRKTGDKGVNGKLRVVGLRNLGNTCFMNAVLQSLSNIQQFCCYFKQLPALDNKMAKNGRSSVYLAKKNNKEKEKDKDDILIAEELRKTLIALWQGNKSAISPESLFSVVWKIVPRFRGYQQQDAHEFLRYVLDRLHVELLNILPFPHSSSPFIGPVGKSTIVSFIFGGMLQNEVKCLSCGTESKKHDPFLDLSLDIPYQFQIKNSKDDAGATTSKLSDCLQSFTELEELADTELYYCSNCKKKQKSTKKFWIRRLPNVLCLHLKRFRWSNYYRTKLDNYVEFPVRGLNMTKFILTNMHETRGSCTGSNLYDLAAVIVHHGSGAGSGHYTAYATHESRWYHFNDSTVTLAEEVSVAKCKAYILFYIRRELKLPNVANSR
uniref:Ubiquitin carboxyl-terminal hydrolase n=1 Tax=Strigamia maritima TaxID=126957 RepID=T1IK79_STRMM